MEYYALSYDMSDSDWESVLDILRNEAEEQVNRHSRDFTSEEWSIAEGLGFEEGLVDGEFVVYRYSDSSDIYQVPGQEGVYIVAEPEALDMHLPEIYSIWTEKGSIEV
jgi:hypothetical protein